jgi:ABC-type antimicrobial peptide transport system permease subunit
VAAICLTELRQYKGIDVGLLIAAMLKRFHYAYKIFFMSFLAGAGATLGAFWVAMLILYFIKN